MGHSSEWNAILEHSVNEVWDVVRDFNSYPIWVNGVEESHIEAGLSGTTVGGIRNFSMGGFRTRQRLLAHSDVERFFTYGSCSSFELQADGCTRTLLHYEGTLRIRPIFEGNRALAEWSTTYDCPLADAPFWASWWVGSLPVWLSSLRSHLDAGS